MKAKMVAVSAVAVVLVGAGSAVGASAGTSHKTVGVSPPVAARLSQYQLCRQFMVSNRLALSTCDDLAPAAPVATGPAGTGGSSPAGAPVAATPEAVAAVAASPAANVMRAAAPATTVPAVPPVRPQTASLPATVATTVAPNPNRCLADPYNVGNLPPGTCYPDPIVNVEVDSPSMGTYCEQTYQDSAVSIPNSRIVAACPDVPRMVLCTLTVTTANRVTTASLSAGPNPVSEYLATGFYQSSPDCYFAAADEGMKVTGNDIPAGTTLGSVTGGGTADLVLPDSPTAAVGVFPQESVILLP